MRDGLKLSMRRELSHMDWAANPVMPKNLVPLHIKPEMTWAIEQ